MAGVDSWLLGGRYDVDRSLKLGSSAMGGMMYESDWFNCAAYDCLWGGAVIGEGRLERV